MNTFFQRWSENKLCVGELTDSMRLSVCKTCLQAGFAADICPKCGIKNWIGKDFFKNPKAVNKLAKYWGITIVALQWEYKTKIKLFKLKLIKNMIEAINKL